tara:strand:- start:279 stop:755 length:477 start_codon:yes stop_codon:yes gene_type:complete
LPARTRNALSIGLVQRLHHRFPNIVGLKDSSENFEQAIAFIRELPDDFKFVTGRDTLIHAVFCEEAATAIAASANVALETAIGIYVAHIASDGDTEAACQEHLVPLRDAFALGTHPEMLKAAADLVGFSGEPPRAPVRKLDQQQLGKFRQLLVGIRKK